MTSKIVYLTGKPGVGKYTIAKALASGYGFILCGNQLINNPAAKTIATHIKGLTR